MLIGTSFATNGVEKGLTYDVEETVEVINSIESSNSIESENIIIVRCCTVEEDGISVKVCGGSDPCAVAEKILDIFME
ncbi:MAG: hypothetical protein IIC74_03835 [Bacteroidetes bacterium]|nr:hypothetical protein [Bacteroidota bacterium]